MNSPVVIVFILVMQFYKIEILTMRNPWLFFYYLKIEIIGAYCTVAIAAPMTTGLIMNKVRIHIRQKFCVCAPLPFQPKIRDDPYDTMQHSCVHSCKFQFWLSCCNFKIFLYTSIFILLLDPSQYKYFFKLGP